MYTSLLRWIARRPAVGPGEEAVGYARLVTPVMSLWIFGSAVEVPVVHLLLPWDAVRNVVLGLSVWGLLWMLGALASLRVHPHLLTPTELRVRHGARITVVVPWAAIQDVRAARRELPSTMRTLHQTGGDLAVAVSGETNVTAVLREPLVVRLPAGPTTIAELSFLVDEPRDFLARAHKELAGTLH